MFTDLARKGYKLIIGTSFGYMDPMVKVAGQFPNVDFVHISGFKRAKNLMTAFGRIEQQRYLSGLVAGSLTKTNIIGYVAAHPIPEVVRGINAFTLGVQAVNPAVTVRVVWSNTWYDPAQEKEAAESLLNARADVIAQHQDSPAAVQAAAAAGKYAVGYNSDMSKFGPKAFLTAPVWNWGPMYLYIAKQVEGSCSWGDQRSNQQSVRNQRGTRKESITFGRRAGQRWRLRSRLRGPGRSLGGRKERVRL